VSTIHLEQKDGFVNFKERVRRTIVLNLNIYTNIQTIKVSLYLSHYFQYTHILINFIYIIDYSKIRSKERRKSMMNLSKGMVRSFCKDLNKTNMKYILAHRTNVNEIHFNSENTNPNEIQFTHRTKKRFDLNSFVLFDKAFINSF